MRINHFFLRLFGSILVVMFALWVPITPAQSAPETQSKPFSQEQLEQILAPIALYPDSLLTQVLMASTYPLEIVQADRWVKQNKDTKGDALAKALEAQRWDPSVKSLVNFPQVLAMMNEKLDWTRNWEMPSLLSRRMSWGLSRSCGQKHRHRAT